MLRFRKYSAVAVALLTGSAFADSTSYTPHATGFTLPNAQQSITALSAQTSNYATTAGSTGFATTAGSANTSTFATSAATATNATNALTANSAATSGYATSSGVAAQAAELTPGNNCTSGTALSVTNGILGCVSSVTSITGQLNGGQIVGNITNVGSISAAGNIVSNGYTYGIGGLFTDNAVFSNIYVDRNGGASANFFGNASTTSYAASTNVGILHQNTGPNGGDGSSFYCDPGYHTVFYDTNVGSTNNAFFFQCVRDGY
jgi:hypothetical protein